MGPELPGALGMKKPQLLAELIINAPAFVPFPRLPGL